MNYQQRIKHYFTFLLLIFLFVSNGSSQSRGAKYNVFIGPGLMYYNGDLRSSLPSFRFMHTSLTLGAGLDLTKQVGLNFRYVLGKISGDDAYSSSEANRVRNLNFYSPMQEFSVRAEYRGLLGWVESWHISGFIGLGMFKYKPKTNIGGTVYELQPLGTEGQNLPNSDYGTPYSLLQYDIPVGIGVSYFFNNQWGVRSEISYHKTFTDYLDDVSNSYINIADLASNPTELSPEQLFLISASSGGKSVEDFPSGLRRGNPGSNDAFVNIAVTVIYRFGKRPGDRVIKDKFRMACPRF